jgi:hypothetical protein
MALAFAKEPEVEPLTAVAEQARVSRNRSFRPSLNPLIPWLRSARRDTGFPAAASSRAIGNAGTFCWRGGPGVRSLAGPCGPAEQDGRRGFLALAGGLARPVVLVPWSRSGWSPGWSPADQPGDRSPAGPSDRLSRWSPATASPRSRWASAVPMARTGQAGKKRRW